MASYSPLRVVCIGGGSGLSTLLSGLKKTPLALTAIVGMTDNGRSSGRLRRQFDMLPPGDIRKCLVALSSEEELLGQLFEFRFKRGRGLSGHNVGNLLLLALESMTGSFEQAVVAASSLLASRGEILPATLERTHIGGILANGERVIGERELVWRGHRSAIDTVFLEPAGVQAHRAALQAISQAEVILIGPGSLYTSIMTNFLLPEMRQAMQDSAAYKLYLCNVSTERGETERYTVERHVQELLKYGGQTVCDAVLVNKRIVRSNGEEGKLGQIRNITTTQKTVCEKPVVLVDVVDEERPLFHDGDKLAAALMLHLKRRFPARLGVKKG